MLEHRLMAAQRKAHERFKTYAVSAVWPQSNSAGCLCAIPEGTVKNLVVDLLRGGEGGCGGGLRSISLGACWGVCAGWLGAGHGLGAGEGAALAVGNGLAAA